MIASLRAKPQSISFASWGIGSTAHLAMLKLEQGADVRFLHVPFTGAGPAFNQLLAGHVDLAFLPTRIAVQYVAAGRVKILGSGATSRDPNYPTIPTLAEQGFENYEADTWMGFFGHAALPPAKQAQLNQAINAVLADPTVQTLLNDQGMRAQALSVGEFRKFVQTQFDQWGKAARALDTSTAEARTERRQ